MKKYLSIAAIALASCAGNTGNNSTADTTTTSADTTAATPAPQWDGQHCYVRTEGTANQDTTTIQLTITGTQVTGQMAWLPKEKDRRKGTLTGTLTGDSINAVWAFMQEGIQDSVKVAFKLSPQKLQQKPLKVNTANGQQQTDETAGYTVEYTATNCGQ